eukprot:TRINITY_DN5018_c0_g1_i1.p1 TRINITY_DN5018_c0_g1~~TRINITY_DN5018_c0_g1_i1.p1  ORF type:complete len:954 (+),score=243.33 TRINITY_DN5018_c0_g1_i1:1994-4855(+)
MRDNQIAHSAIRPSSAHPSVLVLVLGHHAIRSPALDHQSSLLHPFRFETGSTLAHHFNLIIFERHRSTLTSRHLPPPLPLRLPHPLPPPPSTMSTRNELSKTEALVLMLAPCETEDTSKTTDAGTDDLTDRLARYIRSGHPEKVLEANRMCMDLTNVITKKGIAAFEKEAAKQIETLKTPADKAVLMWYGVACLMLFKRANCTGPPLEKDFEREWKSKKKTALLQSLEEDGETPFAFLTCPLLLCAARHVLIVCHYVFSGVLLSSRWWAARCTFVHQRQLSGPTPTLQVGGTRYFDGLLSEDITGLSKNLRVATLPVGGVVAAVDETTVGDKGDPLTTDLVATAFLEHGLFLFYFRESAQAQKAFKQAQLQTGVNFSLTGVRGKRTRFQTFTTPQLVLEAASKSRGETEEDKATTETETETETGAGAEAKTKAGEGARGGDKTMPQNVTNKDEDLLQEVQLDEEEGRPEQKSLHPLDQAIVLAASMDIKERYAAGALTEEEAMAYIARVAQHPNNWMVHSMTLLMRCRLESKRHKTAERAVLQLEVLVNQFPDEEASFQERACYMFALAFPPRISLQKELGRVFLSLGVAASALEIFKPLQLWSEAIRCLCIMDKKDEARQLVNERLLMHPTADLWCDLGDMTGDLENYDKAWDLSKERSSRSMRSKARCLYDAKDFEGCVECYAKALKINPLFPSAWYTNGCAAMQLKQWSVAANAFSRVVQQEPEEGESWSNLAAVYLKMDKQNQAYHALREAVKHKRRYWRIWENYLHVCLAIGKYRDAVHAYHELLTLKGKDIDPSYLRLLTDVVLNNEVMSSGEKGVQLKKPIGELLERITSELASDPYVWDVCADYYGRIGDATKAFDLRQKQSRTLATNKEWVSDEALFLEVCNCAIKMLANATAAHAALPKARYSTRLHVKGVLKRSEDYLIGTEPYKRLEAALDAFLAEVEEEA